MAKLSEAKIGILLGLIGRGRIAVEDIKDAEYRVEVTKRLGGSVK